MKDTCDDFKLAIDDLVDKTVDARITGASEPVLDQAVADHLAVCASCLDYKMANQMIVRAANETPLLTPKADLTRSIMAELEGDFKEQSREQSKQPQLVFLLGAFLLFIGLTIMEVNDSPWNIASWVLALTVVLALKPLLELPQNQGKLATHA
jgi:hypothetical protein